MTIHQIYIHPKKEFQMISLEFDDHILKSSGFKNRNFAKVIKNHHFRFRILKIRYITSKKVKMFKL